MNENEFEKFSSTEYSSMGKSHSKNSDPNCMVIYDQLTYYYKHDLANFRKINNEIPIQLSMEFTHLIVLCSKYERRKWMFRHGSEELHKYFFE